VLLDEALVDFADAQPRDGALALLDEHPRLLVFRTFSKAWGLAGLRCGYALGGPGSEPLLEHLEPDVGVNDLAQAGALEALRSSADRVALRAERLGAEREHLTAELRERGLDVPASQANVVWAAAAGLDGAQLADRLGRTGVHVAQGGPLGEPGRVRITVRDRAASERLLRAVEGALAHRG
jgi:histidinol-phosphate aminotransferase